MLETVPIFTYCNKLPRTGVGTGNSYTMFMPETVLISLIVTRCRALVQALVMGYTAQIICYNVSIGVDSSLLEVVYFWSRQFTLVVVYFWVDTSLWWLWFLFGDKN